MKLSGIQKILKAKHILPERINQLMLIIKVKNKQLSKNYQ